MRTVLNPVLAREARERFRGRKTMMLVSVWVLGIGVLTWLVYYLAREQAGAAGLGRVIATGWIGRFLFEAMAIILMTGVIFVVPGLVALTVIGERERQTFQLLQVSQLGPVQIILGKLSSSLSFFLLLLIAALPMASIPFLFGGTSFGDVVAVLGMIALTAVTFGSIGVWVSSVARSSRGAVAGSFTIALFVALISFALMGAELVMFRPSETDYIGPNGREIYWASVNPYMAMVDAVNQPYELRQQTWGVTPFAAPNLLLFARQGVQMDSSGWVSSVAPGTIRIEDGRQMIRQRRSPLWVNTTVLYLLITALALWRSSVAVRAPGGRLVRTKEARNEGS